MSSSLQSAFICVQKNDLDGLEAIIANDPGIANQCSEDGSSLLHECAIAERPASAALLMRNGADPRLANKEGMTPMHTAALHDSVKVAKEMFSSGCSIDPQDSNGLTPLMCAVLNSSDRMTKSLIFDFDASQFARDKEGRTAAVHAVQCFNHTALTYLLSSNRLHCTMLHPPHMDNLMIVFARSIANQGQEADAGRTCSVLFDFNIPVEFTNKLNQSASDVAYGLKNSVVYRLLRSKISGDELTNAHSKTGQSQGRKYHEPEKVAAADSGIEGNVQGTCADAPFLYKPVLLSSSVAIPAREADQAGLANLLRGITNEQRSEIVQGCHVLKSNAESLLSACKLGQVSAVRHSADAYDAKFQALRLTMQHMNNSFDLPHLGDVKDEFANAPLAIAATSGNSQSVSAVTEMVPGSTADSRNLNGQNALTCCLAASGVSCNPADQLIQRRTKSQSGSLCPPEFALLRLLIAEAYPAVAAPAEASAEPSPQSWDICLSLLCHSAAFEARSLPDIFGLPPLAHAILFGSAESMLWLLTHGSVFPTPMSLSFPRRVVSPIAKSLVSSLPVAEADLWAWFEARRQHMWSVAHLAAMRGDPAIISILHHVAPRQWKQTQCAGDWRLTPLGVCILSGYSIRAVHTILRLPGTESTANITQMKELAAAVFPECLVAFSEQILHEIHSSPKHDGVQEFQAQSSLISRSKFQKMPMSSAVLVIQRFALDVGAHSRAKACASRMCTTATTRSQLTKGIWPANMRRLTTKISNMQQVAAVVQSAMILMAGQRKQAKRRQLKISANLVQIQARACTKIAKHVRGHMVRRSLFESFKSISAIAALPKLSKGPYPKFVEALMQKKSEYLHLYEAGCLLKSVVNAVISSHFLSFPLGQPVLEYWSAVTIQSAMRQFLCRRQVVDARLLLFQATSSKSEYAFASTSVNIDILNSNNALTEVTTASLDVMLGNDSSEQNSWKAEQSRGLQQIAAQNVLCRSWRGYRARKTLHALGFDRGTIIRLNAQLNAATSVSSSKMDEVEESGQWSELQLNGSGSDLDNDGQQSGPNISSEDDAYSSRQQTNDQIATGTITAHKESRVSINDQAQNIPIDSAHQDESLHSSQSPSESKSRNLSLADFSSSRGLESQSDDDRSDSSPMRPLQKTTRQIKRLSARGSDISSTADAALMVQRLTRKWLGKRSLKARKTLIWRVALILRGTPCATTIQCAYRQHLARIVHAEKIAMQPPPAVPESTEPQVAAAPIIKKEPSIDPSIFLSKYQGSGEDSVIRVEKEVQQLPFAGPESIQPYVHKSYAKIMARLLKKDECFPALCAAFDSKSLIKESRKLEYDTVLGCLDNIGQVPRLESDVVPAWLKLYSDFEHDSVDSENGQGDVDLGSESLLAGSVPTSPGIIAEHYDALRSANPLAVLFKLLGSSETSARNSLRAGDLNSFFARCHERINFLSASGGNLYGLTQALRVASGYVASVFAAQGLFSMQIFLGNEECGQRTELITSWLKTKDISKAVLKLHSIPHGQSSSETKKFFGNMIEGLLVSASQCIGNTSLLLPARAAWLRAWHLQLHSRFMLIRQRKLPALLALNLSIVECAVGYFRAVIATWKSVKGLEALQARLQQIPGKSGVSGALEELDSLIFQRSGQVQTQIQREDEVTQNFAGKKGKQSVMQSMAARNWVLSVSDPSASKNGDEAENGENDDSVFDALVSDDDGSGEHDFLTDEDSSLPKENWEQKGLPSQASPFQVVSKGNVRPHSAFAQSSSSHHVPGRRPLSAVPNLTTEAGKNELKRSLHSGIALQSRGGVKERAKRSVLGDSSSGIWALSWDELLTLFSSEEETRLSLNEVKEQFGWLHRALTGLILQQAFLYSSMGCSQQSFTSTCSARCMQGLLSPAATVFADAAPSMFARGAAQASYSKDGLKPQIEQHIIALLMSGKPLYPIVTQPSQSCSASFSRFKPNLSMESAGSVVVDGSSLQNNIRLSSTPNDDDQSCSDSGSQIEVKDMQRQGTSAPRIAAHDWTHLSTHSPHPASSACGSFSVNCDLPLLRECFPAFKDTGFNNAASSASTWQSYGGLICPSLGSHKSLVSGESSAALSHFRASVSQPSMASSSKEIEQFVSLRRVRLPMQIISPRLLCGFAHGDEMSDSASMGQEIQELSLLLSICHLVESDTVLSSFRNPQRCLHIIDSALAVLPKKAVQGSPLWVHMSQFKAAAQLLKHTCFSHGIDWTNEKEKSVREQFRKVFSMLVKKLNMNDKLDDWRQKYYPLQAETQTRTIKRINPLSKPRFDRASSVNTAFNFDAETSFTPSNTRKIYVPQASVMQTAPVPSKASGSSQHRKSKGSNKSSQYATAQQRPPQTRRKQTHPYLDRQGAGSSDSRKLRPGSAVTRNSVVNNTDHSPGFGVHLSSTRSRRPLSAHPDLSSLKVDHGTKPNAESQNDVDLAARAASLQQSLRQKVQEAAKEFSLPEIPVSVARKLGISAQRKNKTDIREP